MTWETNRQRSVYFIQHPLTGLVKIGCSGWPKLRVRELGYIHGAPLELLAFAPGGFREERRMHEMFADERVESEWFSASEGVLAAIEHVRTTGTLPLPDEELREDAIIRRRRAGETLQAIAGDYGITGERVRQIAHEMEAAARRAAA